MGSSSEDGNSVSGLPTMGDERGTVVDSEVGPDASIVTPVDNVGADELVSVSDEEEAGALTFEVLLADDSDETFGWKVRREVGSADGEAIVEDPG